MGNRITSTVSLSRQKSRVHRAMRPLVSPLRVRHERPRRRCRAADERDEHAALHWISSLSPSYHRSCRGLFGLLLVVATDPDNFCDRAVRCAEFQCALTGFGDDGSAVRLDLRNVTVAILYFDPPVVDARTGTGKLRLLDIFAVVDHQGEIDVSVCEVSRDMPARVSCA